MDIRNEIKKFAAKENQSILNWLFDNYHLQSQWSFVAECKFEKYGPYSYQSNRVWIPTKEGIILYKNRDIKL